MLYNKMRLIITCLAGVSKVFKQGVLVVFGVLVCLTFLGLSSHVLLYNHKSLRITLIY